MHIRPTQMHCKHCCTNTGECIYLFAYFQLFHGSLGRIKPKHVKHPRNVFLLPLKEANTNNLWHLKKCIYGLTDALRCWYFRVKENLTKINGHICPADQGIFIWDHNELIRIITCFVDDIIWSGTQYFYKTVIENSELCSRLDQKG